MKVETDQFSESQNTLSIGKQTDFAVDNKLRIQQIWNLSSNWPGNTTYPKITWENHFESSTQCCSFNNSNRRDTKYLLKQKWRGIERKKR